MATINVSTTAQLKTALSSAHAGDTILLAAGKYSSVAIQNFHFTTPVTITSADPAHPAMLTDLTVANSSGLNFNNLELNASGTTVWYPFAVSGSSNINMSHLWVHGSLDGNAADDQYNLMIVRSSTNVTVTHSEFEQTSNALTFLNDSHIELSGNSFHDINTDGIHGGGSSYVTISGNSFTDFRPITDGNHPDAIQVWTTNTTTSAHDITISNNLITRGTGGIMQGIFVTDQVGTLPYSNVSITGNMLVGTMYNGIMVDHASNVNVSSNIVAGYPDMESWIRVQHSNLVTVSNDTAAKFVQANYSYQSSTNTNVSISNFTNLQPTTTQANSMLQTWLTAHADLASIYQNELMWLDGGTTTSTSGGTSSATTGATGTVSTSTTPLNIVGTDAANSLYGGAGNDILNGLGGNDTLTSGAGNDRLYGGTGADKMIGGTGNDSFYVDNVGDSVIEYAGQGDDTVVSTISYTLPHDVERLVLGGSSAINGTGNELNNKITGNDAANILTGGDGADTLVGNGGNDTLIGGTNRDTMIGGAGNDKFVFFNGDIANDRIVDFTSGQDKIDLSGVDANSLLSGDQAFSLIGSSAFGHHAGELRYEQINGNTIVQGDMNGDGHADFIMNLDGLHTLTTSDFIL